MNKNHRSIKARFIHSFDLILNHIIRKMLKASRVPHNSVPFLLNVTMEHEVIHIRNANNRKSYQTKVKSISRFSLFFLGVYEREVVSWRHDFPSPSSLYIHLSKVDINMCHQNNIFSYYTTFCALEWKIRLAQIKYLY